MSRDPVGYLGSPSNLIRYVLNSPISDTDPLGLQVVDYIPHACKITIYVGHNFSIRDMIEDDYPRRPKHGWRIPEHECIAGVGCGTGVDIDGDGKPDSIQDYIEKYNPCNSILAPHLCELDDTVEGLKAKRVCREMRRTLDKARAAARRILNSGSPNPPKCDTEWDCGVVHIEVKCDKDATNLAEFGIWKGRKIPGKYRRNCKGICGSRHTMRSDRR